MMKDVTPVAGKLMSPAIAVYKRTLNSSKGPKQTTSQELESSLADQDRCPPTKKKTQSEASTLESAGSFEVTAADACREIHMLVSNFAEELSERAAADTSQMKELEGILTEARNLESYLKEKKSRLKQTLCVISDKLEG